LKESDPGGGGREVSGITIFLTGLSGAGKSTIAQELLPILSQVDNRPITVLDGDDVRQRVSKELGFSRDDRDANVTRIGAMAAEITRRRGIALCAAIAPYDMTRRQVRRMVEACGKCVLVYVATPLEVCERRDPKGLYVRARAGLIPSFTGISDVYEAPLDADLIADTSQRSVADICEAILQVMRHRRDILTKRLQDLAALGELRCEKLR
jgi:sulfate adenylyltransferase